MDKLWRVGYYSQSVSVDDACMQLMVHAVQEQHKRPAQSGLYDWPHAAACMGPPQGGLYEAPSEWPLRLAPAACMRPPQGGLYKAPPGVAPTTGPHEAACMRPAQSERAACMRPRPFPQRAFGAPFERGLRPPETEGAPRRTGRREGEGGVFA